MKPEKLNKFIAQMKIEIAEAESKHPHFADGVSGRSRMNVSVNLEFMREKNGKPPYMADSILSEEFFEAIEAYQKEELVHAQQELAQCGAVILRTMEMLENEIDNAEGAK